MPLPLLPVLSSALSLAKPIADVAPMIKDFVSKDKNEGQESI
ncbi:hypothetical protein ACFFTM_19690 [Pseudoduganella plicata]|nr:hypothetical protein [Pseudoduganella plicata]